MNLESFGKNPGGERLKKVRQSSYYRNGKFRNLEPTSVNPQNVSVFKILKKMLSRPDTVRPSAEIPSLKANLKDLNSAEPVVVWFGHSSYFIRVDNFNILVDPVFSGHASPLPFFAKAFPGSNKYTVEDLPRIDLLVLTHDHYDHLDWSTIKDLGPKTGRIVTALGVGAHLEAWGIEPENITELSWWESLAIGSEVQITSTPSRHFSGRGLKRAQTLWSSFVLELGNYKIFIGSDSGYDGSFKKIGEKLGPFDLAFLECGQYGEYWPQIHMFPEQTVKAAKDLHSLLTIPVHWGKFVLSTHPWNEPVRRFLVAAEEDNCAYATPKIGEAFYFTKEYRQDRWWEFENKKS